MSDKKRKVASIKGTRDILPPETRTWQRVEQVCSDVYELYGYRQIRTPVFEATELFEKGTGETSDIVTKEMYTFTDKGGRSLTLRPEYTPSVVRAIMQNRLYLKPEPMRFYFIGPMFRYDKPQKGRFRQFHQADIEVFGEEDPAVDAEIVEMADYMLKKVGVAEFRILVNSVGCMKCRPPYFKDLRNAAKAGEKELCPDCRSKVDINPLRIFDCKQESCREASKEFPLITDYLCRGCREHFEGFQKYLDVYGLSYRVDPRLVRGLDYYTKSTFEIISSQMGAQDAVLGGGRYDDLMKIYGGPDICGIGFAMGMERLLSLVPGQRDSTDFIYIAFRDDASKQKAMTLAEILRRQDIECLIEYKDRSLGKQLSRANKLKASWSVIIGEEELHKQVYQLKNMRSGEQHEVTESELLEKLR
jgi:histidyl-tRNA synthetase